MNYNIENNYQNSETVGTNKICIVNQRSITVTMNKMITA